MKSEKYIEFEQTYLSEIYQRFYFDTIDYMNNEYGKLAGILTKQMENVLYMIVDLQKTVPVQVGCIQGSYLLSSLRNGKPEMMYEVYGEGKEFGTLLMARTESGAWLLPYWENLHNEIREKIRELHWECFLGEEEVKTFVLEGMISIFMYLPYKFKYLFREFESWAKALEIQTEADFYVSLGEYRGWRKILYMKRTTKDVFLEIQEKQFQFMNFKDCIYEEKRFLNKNFTSASFTKCLFLSCTFKGVDFTDCNMWDCVFRNCVFDNCVISGCEFEDCDMQRVEWKNCDFTSGVIMSKKGLKNICRNAGFYASVLHKHIFEHSDLAECIIKSCDEEDIVIGKECVIVNSDFQKQMGRNGNYEVL